MHSYVLSFHRAHHVGNTTIPTNSLRIIVVGLAAADAGIQLRRAVRPSSYCDADWVVALRAEFGDEHTTFDYLGRASRQALPFVALSFGS
jgi:hypothetical protein